MLVKSYHYRAVRVDVVTLDPNERVTFDDHGAESAIGSIYVRGVISPVGSDWGPSIDSHTGWRPRYAWGGWKGDGGPKQAVFVAGTAGAQWVCLSNTRGSDRTVQYVPIAGSYKVPAGWGVVVASGTITDNGQQGAIGNYFAPRDQDREVTGNGDLLLLQ